MGRALFVNACSDCSDAFVYSAVLLDTAMLFDCSIQHLNSCEACLLLDPQSSSPILPCGYIHVWDCGYRIQQGRLPPERCRLTILWNSSVSLVDVLLILSAGCFCVWQVVFSV